MSIELIYIGGLVLIICAVLSFVMSMSYSTVGITATLNELKELTSHLSNAQSEISGRISQHQSSFNERLENLSKGLNDGFAKQSERATKSIADLDKNLQVRMEAIKDAQKTMTNLSEEMVGLQNILDNKQARGAFGETQLRDLVVNMLPPSIYQFQATLSNGKIVDCLLKLEKAKELSKKLNFGDLKFLLYAVNSLLSDLLLSNMPASNMTTFLLAFNNSLAVTNPLNPPPRTI